MLPVVGLLAGDAELHGESARDPVAPRAAQGMEDGFVQTDAVVVGGEEGLADVDVHAGRVGFDEANPVRRFGRGGGRQEPDQKQRGRRDALHC